MLAAISPLPVAASVTLRFISRWSRSAPRRPRRCGLVVVDLADDRADLARSPSTAPAVSAWMASTRRAMSSVALAVSWARSLTSLATTAKPLPASPARAASMVALSASRLVCSAIEVMTLTTLPISGEDSPSLATVGVRGLGDLHGLAATWAASLAFWAISRIEAPISSAPAATVCTLRETCSAAAATTLAWARGLLGAGRDGLREPMSFSAAAASAWADSAVARTVVRRLSEAWFRASAIWPTSSREVTSTRAVRSPAAMATRPLRTAVTGRIDQAGRRAGPGPRRATRPDDERRRG